jgi:hypothetical protein
MRNVATLRDIMKPLSGLAFIAITLLTTQGFAKGEVTESFNKHRANIAAAEDLPPVQSGHDPLPAAPSLVSGHHPTIVKQAGIGGPVAYGRNGVVELGGSFSLLTGENYTNMLLAPTAGWFFTDNFEVSAIGQVSYTSSGQDHYTVVTALVEPSVHLPIVDNMFIFGGWGLGAAYDTSAKKPGFAMAPRLGVNVLVGRSGILTPSATMNFSTIGAPITTAVGTAVSVKSMYGLNLQYTVML